MRCGYYRYNNLRDKEYKERKMSKKVSKKCEEAFIEKYIIGNWFEPKDLGLAEDEVMPFKEYLSMLACNGYFNVMMKQHMEVFRQGKDADGHYADLELPLDA